jgi:hypothetical protein
MCQKYILSENWRTGGNYLIDSDTDRKVSTQTGIKLKLDTYHRELAPGGHKGQHDSSNFKLHKPQVSESAFGKSLTYSYCTGHYLTSVSLLLKDMIKIRSVAFAKQ